MSGDPRQANGARRRAIKKRWRAIGDPCHLCGRPIDYSLTTWINPRTGKRCPHPWSFVVDEINPVDNGGDPLDFENTQPAHWICNSRKGAKVPLQLGGGRPPTSSLPLPQAVDF